MENRSGKPSSTGTPVSRGRRFDPVDSGRVPLFGHPVSTGAACPRRAAAIQARVVGARCQPNRLRTCRPARCGCPDQAWREPREQAYVPAEQPPPSQGARLPPADAHPRGSRDPVVASPQGPQEPRRLTARRRPGRPVLSAAHRLTDGATFRRTIRSGRRAGSRTLVVHLTPTGGDTATQVGFVVSKAVGNAVVRNRVKRRLRHLAREHVSTLPGSAVLVVRALPAAAAASYGELGADLGRCLSRVMSEVSR